MEKRITFVFIVFILFFGLISMKLLYWQVLSSERLNSLAYLQRNRSNIITALRGRIFASDGKPLVINKITYGIYLEPKKITDKDKLFDSLSRIIDLKVSTISALLARNDLLWIPIAHKIDEMKVNEIKKGNISGLSFMEEQDRYYPEASMASHLLGFVGKNAQGQDQGYFGIEGYYDDQLRGRDGLINEEHDAFGNPILSGEREIIPAENGRDLILNLDKTIQYIADNKLKQGIEKYGAKGGSVIIMDPQTGGILAMSSYPSYDGGRFSDYPSQYYKNPAISTFYEPGSTFKTLVMSMAINEDKVKAETEYNEEGPVEIGGYSIRTWNHKYHGKINLMQILSYSSNVGMVFIEKQLPKNTFINYLMKLGINDLTGVDLQEESTLPMRPKNKWYEIDYATASFGQGIAMTPLQMLVASSVIANGGKLMEPHTVKSIKLPDARIINIYPKVIRNVFTEKTTSIVKEMMVNAVDSGETKYLKPASLRIAGKTGTAQIPIAGHYEENKTIASFVGFAPAEEPRFVMLVTINEPTSSPWGSETAAPVFFAIAREIYPYLKISS